MKLCTITLDDVNQAKLDVATMPRTEALLASAKSFSRFVAAPNCSNFRAKLESGLYSHRPDNQTGGIYNGTATASLPVGPHTLGNCGAVTSHIGKHHLCAHDHLTHRAACGYDHYAGSQANLKSGAGTGYFSWETVTDGVLTLTTVYATDYVASKAIERIQLGDDFVNVSFNVAHEPVHAPPGYGDSSVTAMLSYADDAIADVVEEALAAGYLVLLCSDNGGTADDGGKGNLSVEALHTFLYLLGPWPATRPDCQVVDATDLHATAWDLLTGVTPPGSDGIPLTISRPVAFADKFGSVGVPPGGEWVEMATDGVSKVQRRVSTGAWIATDWWDDPTTADVSHLLAALDAR